MSFYLPPLAKKKAAFGAKTLHSRIFEGSHFESGFETTHRHFFTSIDTSGSRDMAAAERGLERRNRPHGNHLGFNRDNPRLINAPLCRVKTERRDSQWWPSESEIKAAKQPCYNRDTTSRTDYQLRFDPRKMLPITRHGCNVSYKQTAVGIVPALTKMSSDEPRALCECISYRHQYNCRMNPNQPNRGKLHGSFVWKPLFQPEDLQNKKPT
eukprot:m.39888 g.39888  ORF g.39888 m.39888 type:complete len:211 (+) comp32865_c0_seq4:43-675(+)